VFWLSLVCFYCYFSLGRGINYTVLQNAQIGASAMSLAGPLALDSLVKKAESPPSIVRVKKQWDSDDSSESNLLPKLLEESFERWGGD
jgi:hypothetical protein